MSCSSHSFRGVYTEFLTNNTEPCLVCSNLSLRPLQLATNSCCKGATICKSFECKLCVFVKFVVKLSIMSEFCLSIIKLTDALKELIETNCCKYDIEVASHLNVPI